jgi:hypothetical protein
MAQQSETEPKTDPLTRIYTYKQTKTLTDGTVKQYVYQQKHKLKGIKPGRVTANNKKELRAILKHFDDTECKLIIDFCKDQQLGKFKEVPNQTDEESDIREEPQEKVRQHIKKREFKATRETQSSGESSPLTD